MKNKYAHIRDLADIDQELLKLDIKKRILISDLRSHAFTLKNRFTFKSVGSDLLQGGIFTDNGLNFGLLFRVGVLLFKSFKSGGGWMRKLMKITNLFS